MERRREMFPMQAIACFQKIVRPSATLIRIELLFMDSPTSIPDNPQKSCASDPAKAEKCNFQRFEPLGKVDYRASRT